MGYVIVCQAPSNHGKSTVIKLLCSELESMSSSNFEVLYQDNQGAGKDILRAYRRFGLLIYVISAGDYDSLLKDGYNKLQYACGGFNCDILICAATKNEERQREKHRRIEDVINIITREGGHYLERVKIKNFHDENNVEDSNANQLKTLREAFVSANDRLLGSRVIKFS